MSALRWGGPVLLLVELALVLSGRLSLATAAGVLVAVEALLAVVLAGQAVAAARGYRRRRADGASPAQAAEAAVRAALPGPVATAVLHEARLLHALGRWLRRRPDVPPGATPLPVGRDERVTGWALLVASLVEMAAVHLLLPWPAVRTVLLVVSAYGTVLLVALLADRAVRPHLLLADGLRLRAGGAVDVTLPLSAVDGVVLRRRDAPRPVAFDDAALVLASGGQTQLEVSLLAPLTLRAGRREGTVTAVRFSADDPAAAVATVRARLGDRARR